MKVVQYTIGIVVGGLILVALYNGVIQGGFNYGWGL